MKWLDQAEEDLHTGKEKEEQDEDSFEKLSKEDFDRKVQEQVALELEKQKNQT